jgi:hypothetical protein
MENAGDDSVVFDFQQSVNYVIWGAMNRLCKDDPQVWVPESEDQSTLLVYLYKSVLPAMKGDAEAANFGPATAWTKAGYNGWPEAPTPPGDRPSCKCECPQAYSNTGPKGVGETYPVIWAPFVIP